MREKSVVFIVDLVIDSIGDNALKSGGYDNAITPHELRWI